MADDRSKLRAAVKPYVQDADFTLYVGDVREVLATLPDESVQCCVTSPPYWGLRDYGVDGQLGLDATPELYVAAMTDVFREVRRVLRKDGTCWLNIGDSYSHGGNGSRDPERWPKQSRNDHRVEHAKAAGDTKPKDLMGIPWRVAFALQADGWYLRSEIIWSKPNPMPESVTDRPTKSHEQVFLLSRSPRYFYDAEAIAEAAQWERWGDQTVVKPQPGTASWIKPKSKQELTGENRPNGRGDTYSGFNARYAAADPAERKTKNARSVWEIPTQPFAEAHFATYPQALVERCLKAGTKPGDVVLDPFLGSGTTSLVSRRLGRRSIGIELNESYAEMAARRLGQQSLLAEPAA